MQGKNSRLSQHQQDFQLSEDILGRILFAVRKEEAKGKLNFHSTETLWGSAFLPTNSLELIKSIILSKRPSGLTSALGLKR